MNKDCLGICLSQGVLQKHLQTTFTHVRAYSPNREIESSDVILAYPQLSGQQVLDSMQGSSRLIWRAEFSCEA
ncbi:hypothetical protein QWZ05_18445 [Vibrio agarivorans]|jgi:hypothetical protein|uniref:Cation transporter n=1 Tax=Vibrio agarivorans TaxID=153622 RepID=A0ABT7XYK8_9VIBR|nr:hypothetical protein [Vibrio agarivorans]MDN2480867.1 hypothetical protein [Vibrio agarivorans]MDN3663056.1 hypothetical protein [Vibrio agarivorans]